MDEKKEIIESEDNDFLNNNNIKEGNSVEEDRIDEYQRSVEENKQPLEDNKMEELVVEPSTLNDQKNIRLESNKVDEKMPKKKGIRDKVLSIQNRMRHVLFGDGYVEFTKLLVTDIVFFVCLLVLGVLLLSVSFASGKVNSISYKESSNLDYNVYLLPNDFYDDDHLEKNMIYIASLIDYINVDFDYRFDVSKKLDMDFTYKILADLEITNKEGTRSFYKKNYVLLDSQTLNMKDNNLQKISEKVKIDYSHYNSLANNFKASYGVDTDSKLVVYMVVEKHNPKKSRYSLNESKTMSVTIPLSQKAVDIKVPYDDINNSNSIIQKSQSSIQNYFTFILSLFFLACSVYSWFLIVRKMMLIGPNNSAYDNYLNKILKRYDRLIGESDTLPSFEGKNVIKFRKFTELLDVHDNLQLPIIQYTITKHHKCYFYISYKDTVYLYVLKAVDLEESQNEK